MHWGYIFALNHQFDVWLGLYSYYFMIWSVNQILRSSCIWLSSGWENLRVKISLGEWKTGLGMWILYRLYKRMPSPPSPPPPPPPPNLVSQSDLWQHLTRAYMELGIPMRKKLATVTAHRELTVSSPWKVTEPWPGPWLSCDLAVTESWSYWICRDWAVTSPWLSCDLAVIELWPRCDLS